LHPIDFFEQRLLGIGGRASAGEHNGRDQQALVGGVIEIKRGFLSELFAVDQRLMQSRRGAATRT
jgi:hypothetical protein